MKSMLTVREVFQNVPWLGGHYRAGRLGIGPEFDDLELIRLAAPDAVLAAPGWDRRLALFSGGLRRV